MLKNLKILFLIMWVQLKKGFFMNPLIIYSQAWHETAGFTSQIFKENNNLFGMKQAQVRENTATGTNRGHATYNSLKDSIIDYVLRQKNFSISPVSNFDLYADATFSSNYAEDSNYIASWKNVFEIQKGKMKYYKWGLMLIAPVSLIAVGYGLFIAYKRIF